MAYKMKQLTDKVRVGMMSDGSLDIEVWQTPFGWEPHVVPDEDLPEEIVIPPEAVDELFEYLRGKS